MAMLSLYGCTVCHHAVIYGCHVVEIREKKKEKKKFVTCPPSFGTMCVRIHVSCHVVRVCWLYDAHTGCEGIASSSLAWWELWFLFLVFLFAHFFKARNSVNSTVCTVSPPHCVVAALSVLIYRLHLAKERDVFAKAVRHFWGIS